MLLGPAVGSEEPWRIIKDLTRQKSAQGIQIEEEDKPVLDSPACDIERLEVEPSETELSAIWVCPRKVSV